MGTGSTGRQARPPSGLRRRLRFLLLVLAALLVTGLAWHGISKLRVATIAEAPLLRSQFAHADHRRTSCTRCHHNFEDATGTLSCYNCHKKETRSESTRIDVIFHDFCTGCHREERAAGKRSGPVRSCSGCHNAEATRRVSGF